MAEENWLNDYVFTVEGFLSESECRKYVDISEELGYEEATVTGPQGHVMRKDVRNNQRVVFKSHEIAQALWERAEDFVPREQEGRFAAGVNEMLRFYRYDPGQQFNWHQDVPYERDNGEHSRWTFMLYLNDGFEGGETSFEDSYSDESFDAFKVVPTRGMALFFEHQTNHKGEPVAAGRKYVLRTDVMYSGDEPYGSTADFDDEFDDDFVDDPDDNLEW